MIEIHRQQRLQKVAGNITSQSTVTSQPSADNLVFSYAKEEASYKTKKAAGVDDHEKRAMKRILSVAKARGVFVDPETDPRPGPIVHRPDPTNEQWLDMGAVLEDSSVKWEDAGIPFASSRTHLSSSR